MQIHIYVIYISYKIKGSYVYTCCVVPIPICYYSSSSSFRTKDFINYHSGTSSGIIIF